MYFCFCRLERFWLVTELPKISDSARCNISFVNVCKSLEVWMWDLDCLGPKRLEFAISPVDAAEIFRTSNLWLSFLAVCQCVLGLFLEGSFQGSLLKWVQILPDHNQDVLYHVVDMSPLFVCFIHFTTNLGALLTPRSWSFVPPYVQWRCQQASEGKRLHGILMCFLPST